MDAAPLAPELLHVCETMKVVYSLPVDPPVYDSIFQDAFLPDWHGHFTMKDAVAACDVQEIEIDLRDFEPCLYTPAESYREIANIRALRVHLDHLEYLVRFKLSNSVNAARLGLLRACIARLESEGTSMVNDLFAIDVQYCRIAGCGRRYTCGPSMQRLSGIGVALRGVLRIFDVDQEAALYRVLLDRCGSSRATKISIGSSFL